MSERKITNINIHAFDFNLSNGIINFEETAKGLRLFNMGVIPKEGAFIGSGDWFIKYSYEFKCDSCTNTLMNTKTYDCTKCGHKGKESIRLEYGIKEGNKEFRREIRITLLLG